MAWRLADTPLGRRRRVDRAFACPRLALSSRLRNDAAAESLRPRRPAACGVRVSLTPRCGKAKSRIMGSSPCAFFAPSKQCCCGIAQAPPLRRLRRALPNTPSALLAHPAWRARKIGSFATESCRSCRFCGVLAFRASGERHCCHPCGFVPFAWLPEQFAERGCLFFRDGVLS